MGAPGSKIIWGPSPARAKVPGKVPGCPVRAAIATRNPGKLRPAQRALRYLCGASIVMVDPPNGLPPQPVGSIEVVRGALARARKAFKELGGRGLGIGVEAGLLEFYTSTGYIEGQVAIVIGPGERASIGLSAAFELPHWIVARMKRGEELGRIYRARRSVGDIGESIGYIGVSTWGLVSREDLTFQAVAMALVPWVRGEEASLQRAEELERTINI